MSSAQTTSLISTGVPTVAAFVMLGPPAGLVAVAFAVMPSMLNGLWSSDAMGLWLVGYIFGAIPALLTGVGYAMLSGGWRNPLVSALIGIAISSIGVAIVGGFRAIPLFALAGGTAGLVCGFITMDWSRVLDYFSGL